MKNFIYISVQLSQTVDFLWDVRFCNKLLTSMWKKYEKCFLSCFPANFVLKDLGHVLPMFVCLSQLFVAAPLGRFWWNFTQITLSKIWEDIILFFFKFYLYDVIKAFLKISFAALLRFLIESNFLQIDILRTLTKDIVWDCKPAFSVDFFNSIWPIKMAKMTVKINFCVKIKTKHCFVLISSRWWRIWPWFLRRMLPLPVKKGK